MQELKLHNLPEAQYFHYIYIMLAHRMYFIFNWHVFISWSMIMHRKVTEDIYNEYTTGVQM